MNFQMIQAMIQCFERSKLRAQHTSEYLYHTLLGTNNHLFLEVLNLT